MLVETLEWVKDDDGGHFMHGTREIDFELRTEREHFVCTMCRINCYPECMNQCGKWKKSRKSRV